MCVIAVKYFEDTGWVGIKNRDRNYKPSIRIRQLMRKGVERLVIWDDITKYTEGVNEFGVCILNAATDVKKDEKIGVNTAKSKKPKRGDPNFYAPDGLRIRNALLKRTPEAALKELIKTELRGSTLIFNEDECYLLEGMHEERGREEWVYKVQKIKKGETVARTNHGILIDWAGYPKNSDDEHLANSRKSSEERLRVAQNDISKVTDPIKMMDAASSTKNSNPQMNPLRIEKRHGRKILRTTGQIMLVPKERTLHYRPIWGDVEFDDGINNDIKSKTNFEIVSSKKLLTFKEWSEQGSSVSVATSDPRSN